VEPSAADGNIRLSGVAGMLSSGGLLALMGYIVSYVEQGRKEERRTTAKQIEGILPEESVGYLDLGLGIDMESSTVLASLTTSPFLQ
jgi:hypothetical protein